MSTLYFDTMTGHTLEVVDAAPPTRIVLKDRDALYPTRIIAEPTSPWLVPKHWIPR